MRNQNELLVQALAKGLEDHQLRPIEVERVLNALTRLNSNVPTGTLDETPEGNPSH